MNQQVIKVWGFVVSGRGLDHQISTYLRKRHQKTPTIEYRTDPEQAKTIADLQSRLDALTQSTKARELELADAPEPVPGITQEQVNQQLADLVVNARCSTQTSGQKRLMNCVHN